MSELKTISVFTTQPSLFRVVARQTVMWGYLLIAEGISHLWFGGSWVIDMMVLMGLALLAANRAMNDTGFRADMTTAEIRLWVAAGAPPDIKQWRASCKLHEVA